MCRLVKLILFFPFRVKITEFLIIETIFSVLKSIRNSLFIVHLRRNESETRRL